MAIWSRFNGEFTGIKIKGKKTSPTWGFRIPFWSGFVKLLAWNNVITVTVQPSIAKQGYRVVYQQAGGIALVSGLVYYERVQVNIGPQPCTIAALDSSGKEIADVGGPEEIAAAEAALRDVKTADGAASQPQEARVFLVRIDGREHKGQEFYLKTPLI
jgi:hypothetical protein